MFRYLRPKWPKAPHVYAVLWCALIIALPGCTFHPRGESEERRLADEAGKALKKELPPLPENAPLQQIIDYTLLPNAELEQRYWEWRAAIEQIPQSGTQQTNPALSAGIPITSGSTAFDRTTVTLSNDPMADIVWPAKL